MARSQAFIAFRAELLAGVKLPRLIHRLVGAGCRPPKLAVGFTAMLAEPSSAPTPSDSIQVGTSERACPLTPLLLPLSKRLRLALPELLQRRSDHLFRRLRHDVHWDKDFARYRVNAFDA